MREKLDRIESKNWMSHFVAYGSVRLKRQHGTGSVKALDTVLLWGYSLLFPNLFSNGLQRAKIWVVFIFVMFCAFFLPRGRYQDGITDGLVSQGSA